MWCIWSPPHQFDKHNTRPPRQAAAASRWCPVLLLNSTVARQRERGRSGGPLDRSLSGIFHNRKGKVGAAGCDFLRADKSERECVRCCDAFWWLACGARRPEPKPVEPHHTATIVRGAPTSADQYTHIFPVCAACAIDNRVSSKAQNIISVNHLARASVTKNGMYTIVPLRYKVVRCAWLADQPRAPFVLQIKQFLFTYTLVLGACILSFNPPSVCLTATAKHAKNGERTLVLPICVCFFVHICRYFRWRVCI